jgi:transcriptional regulator with XRE-family HTH domain
MANSDELLVRRRQLSEVLLQLRERALLSGRDLAERIGISQSKVSRIESGATLPTVEEVTSWARATNASAADREVLEMRTDAAHTEAQSFDDILRGPGHIQKAIQKLEKGSGVKLAYQPSVVPGLLQNPEYARRLLAMFRPPYPEQYISAVVAARLDRQNALFEPARQFQFLITEAALRFRVGPAAVMAAQLDRIAALGSLENVEIGLIPSDAPAQTFVPHGFTIFEAVAGGTDALVMAETVHANLTLSLPSHVRLYREQWILLKLAAVYDAGARELLAKVSQDIREHAAPDLSVR